MADIDADDDLDLIIGDDEGKIKLYLRDGDELSFAENMAADDWEIDVGDRAAPRMVDWDLDGDLDMLVGMAGGVIALFLNTGSAEEYEYTFVDFLYSNDEEIWMVMGIEI